MFSTLATTHAEGFREFLRQEMHARQWRKSTLAERLGVRYNVVARWFDTSQDVEPGPESLRRIAEAFEMDPVFVFRKAGLLPDLSADLKMRQRPHIERLEARVRLFERVLLSCADEGWPVLEKKIDADIQATQRFIYEVEQLGGQEPSPRRIHRGRDRDGVADSQDT